MSARILVLAAIILAAAAPIPALAAPDDPDPGDAPALRECVKSKGGTKAGDATCVEMIVKTCMTAFGNDHDSTVRDCNRRSEAAWDVILNAEYGALRDKLPAAQMAKLRDQQRAWIKAKDKKCNAIYKKFQGAMAYPPMAVCFNCEVARRALYLMRYQTAAKSL